MILALCAFGGSPGATSTALATTIAVGPDALLVEADERGSTLSTRFGLSADKGVRSLLPVLLSPNRNREAHLVELEKATTLLPMGDASSSIVRTILGVPLYQQQSRLPAFWQTFAHLVKGSREVIVDCGRLAPGTPLMPILNAADRIWVLLDPTLEHVITAKIGMARLGIDDRSRTMVLASSSRPHSPSEVADHLALEVAELPIDYDGATALAGYPVAYTDITRSLLVKACHDYVNLVG